MACLSNRLIPVGDHSVITVCSDFSVTLLTIVNKQAEISMNKKTIPVVDHAVGCTSVFGKLVYTSSLNQLFYINSHDSVSSIRLESLSNQPTSIHTVSSILNFQNTHFFTLSKDRSSILLDGEERILTTVKESVFSHA